MQITPDKTDNMEKIKFAFLTDFHDLHFTKPIFLDKPSLFYRVENRINLTVQGTHSQTEIHFSKVNRENRF